MEMARTARKHSDTGVCHAAILRGVNKQQFFFECTEDYQRFLNILRAQTLQEQDEAGHRSKPHCVIYAYCQMGNHVHLLIKESGETLALDHEAHILLLCILLQVGMYITHLNSC